MLTDVFFNRYEETKIWTGWGERERRFFVQIYRVITEQLVPIVRQGPEEFYQNVESLFSMEIGAREIGPSRSSQKNIMEYLLNHPLDAFNADSFMKLRLSLIEVVFKKMENEIRKYNSNLNNTLLSADAKDRSGNQLFNQITDNFGASSWRDYYQRVNDKINKEFNGNVMELNERMRQARIPLMYHGGALQFSNDPLIATEVERPFWSLVASPKWENVENDMLEAIDRRDNGRKDAALSAAKALESVIKIISNEKGWTKGSERGAANYIDNLVSAANGRFIDVWESNVLKNFFSEVRNKLGHGPGGEPMPELNHQQESWAIETCMSWVKSLITRM